MKRSSSRRDFLRGKAARDALRAPLVRPASAGPGKESNLEPYYLRIQRHAMACDFDIRIPAERYPHGTEAALSALDLVDALEQRFSYFKPENELAAINDAAGGDPILIERDLYDLIEISLLLGEETGGALDITSAPLSEAWGFARRSGRVPDDAQIAEALRLVGAPRVELDPEGPSLRLPEAGMKLNLGAVGKGYAIDQVVQYMEKEAVHDTLVHGGGSSVAARGRADGRPEAPDGWPVGIAHPQRDGRVAEITLKNRALATSGGRQQAFVHRGRRYSHILDPRTGRPAEGCLSVTVVAPSALLADALSTALFVLGPEKAIEFCDSRDDLAVVAITPGQGPAGITIQQTGFDKDELVIL